MSYNKSYERVAGMIRRLNGKRKLVIRDIDIETLPPLPENLLILHCINTKLSSLPTVLPAGLEELDISYTRTIKELPSNLPDRIRHLKCFHTGITSLPNHLPYSLIELDVSDTYIKELPDIVLPHLRLLLCNKTKIKYIPDNIARDLTYLSCFEGRLERLPNNMRQITFICCMSCPIKNLPDHIPQTLHNISLLYTLLPNKMEDESAIDYITRIDRFKLNMKDINTKIIEYNTLLTS